MTRNCSNCIYLDSTGANLICRREPPVPVGAGGITTWPTVSLTDWCGRHEVQQIPGTDFSTLDVIRTSGSPAQG